jgi:hypothetical protein
LIGPESQSGPLDGKSDPTKSLAEVREEEYLDNKKLVKLDNLNGYKEYQRALKIISGEEVSPVKDDNQVQN